MITFMKVMMVIGMKIMDNCMALQVGRERPPEGSHLGKFTQYSQRYPTQPTLEKKFTQESNTYGQYNIIVIHCFGENPNNPAFGLKSTDVEKIVFLVGTI